VGICDQKSCARISAEDITYVVEVIRAVHFSRHRWHAIELCRVSVIRTSRAKEQELLMGEFPKESGPLIMEQSQPSIKDDSWHMNIRSGYI
jgi:hypothetical protein